MTGHNKAVDSAKQLQDRNAVLETEGQDVSKHMTNLQSELSAMKTKHHQTNSKANVLTHNNSLLQAEVDGPRTEAQSRIRGQWEGGRDFKRFLLGVEVESTKVCESSQRWNRSLMHVTFLWGIFGFFSVVPLSDSTYCPLCQFRVRNESSFTLSVGNTETEAERDDHARGLLFIITFSYCDVSSQRFYTSFAPLLRTCYLLP
jgi:hypothetical protein